MEGPELAGVGWEGSLQKILFVIWCKERETILKTAFVISFYNNSYPTQNWSSAYTLQVIYFSMQISTGNFFHWI